MDDVIAPILLKGKCAMNKKILAGAVTLAILAAPVVGTVGTVGMVDATTPVGISRVAEAATVTATVGEGAEYSSLGSALAALKGKKATAYTIKLAPGTYREKVTIDLPNVTLVGRDAASTVIIWDDAEGTPLRPGDEIEGKTTYKMECATVKVTKDATGFQAVNVTFANDFPTEEKRADKSMKDVQAFAATVEADHASFYGCRFLGRQDTLYANAGTQYYSGCYIEGDVDFIFGQGTAVFEGCEIKSLMRAVKDDGAPHSTGYVTAPSTLATDKGYLFYRCHLTSDIESPHYALLGRPWHPSSETREVNSAAAFVECQIDTPMKEKAWNSMKNKFGVYQPEDNRLFEYNNTGKGAVKGGNRRQLTDAEAASYTPAAFLGSWKPAKRA